MVINNPPLPRPCCRAYLAQPQSVEAVVNSVPYDQYEVAVPVSSVRMGLRNTMQFKQRMGLKMQCNIRLAYELFRRHA